MFLQRRNGAPTPAKGLGLSGASESELAKWGALYEFLFSESWPDGAARRTGTLLIFPDEGRLKACLSDRDQGLVGFATGSSILELLEAVERALREDSVDWRASRTAAKERRRT